MARDLRTVARMVNAEVATTLINRAYQPAIPMAENGPTMSGGLVIRYSERDLQPLVSFRRLAHSEDAFRLSCEGPCNSSKSFGRTIYYTIFLAIRRAASLCSKLMVRDFRFEFSIAFVYVA